jgi:hypothetical protein
MAEQHGGEEEKEEKIKEPTVPKFIRQLSMLLENPALENIVQWNSQGTAFIVKNAALFAQEVLPVYYKHSKFESFARNLNLYGFYRTSNSAVLKEWAHTKFVRGHPEWLAGLTRDAIATGSRMTPHRGQYYVDEDGSTRRHLLSPGAGAGPGGAPFSGLSEEVHGLRGQLGEVRAQLAVAMTSLEQTEEALQLAVEAWYRGYPPGDMRSLGPLTGPVATLITEAAVGTRGLKRRRLEEHAGIHTQGGGEGAGSGGYGGASLSLSAYPPGGQGRGGPSWLQPPQRGSPRGPPPQPYLAPPPYGPAYYEGGGAQARWVSPGGGEAGAGGAIKRRPPPPGARFAPSLSLSQQTQPSQSLGGGAGEEEGGGGEGEGGGEGGEEEDDESALESAHSLLLTGSIGI